MVTDVKRLPPEAIEIGYAMSRLDDRYLAHRRLPSWQAAYREAATALNVNSPFSFKNLRDEFDPYHDNERRGWHQREIRPDRAEVLERWRDRGDAQLLRRVDDILARGSADIHTVTTPVPSSTIVQELPDQGPRKAYAETMMNNELVLLDRLLEQRQADRPTPIREDDAFELFVCEQAMREFGLTPEEIADGIIGGGDDGGIDGIYVLLGSDATELLADDSDIVQTGRPARRGLSDMLLQIWLIQAKRTPSFTERAVEAVTDTVRRVLSLEQSDSDLRKLYSAELVRRTGYFRAALRNLMFAKVEVHFIYATRGRVTDVHDKVRFKATDLERVLEQEVLHGSTVAKAEFLGAAELWERAYSRPPSPSQLVYQESAVSEDSYVALVKLRDYIAFLSDDDGDLRRELFELNVRDYQGNVEVNREIQKSLEERGGPEFWWLNNGVTVVCSRVEPRSKTYSISNAQIVNGLQTSFTIHRELHDAPDNHPAFDKSVLVRILVTEDNEEVRDRVIRATNHQTAVTAASLRATEDIQRKIEAYFAHHKWWYDRRKGYYRNQNQNPERIVSIEFLAQATMAMGLGRPDHSRARPSSLLKDEARYKQLFNDRVPLAVYLWFAESQKMVDVFLLTDRAKATVTERTNFHFHLAMVAAAKLAGSRVKRPEQLAKVVESGRRIEEAGLSDCLHYLRERLRDYRTGHADPEDKIAKGTDFVEELLVRLF